MSFDRYPKNSKLFQRFQLNVLRHIWQIDYALDLSDYRIHESPISPE